MRRTTEHDTGPRRARRGVALVATTALLLGACSTGGDDGGDASPDGTGAPGGGGSGEPTIIPGTQEVTVTGLAPHSPATLMTEDQEPIVTLISDDVGQVHTAYVPDEPLTFVTGGENVIPDADGQSLKPGTYRFELGEGDDATLTEPFEVWSVDDHPDPSLYEEQTLTGVTVNVVGTPVDDASPEEGYQYLEMRDGTLLSAMVRFPDPAVYGEGPYPTVVEYQGYDSVSDPDGQQPGSRIAQALGYATVGVAMRGTGCSGGAFDVFSPAQQADGYDVIEIVGHQDWVDGGRVGMVGLSYSGITQLYTASTNPPHLAAITAQSTIVDAVLAQWPGGIYNSGFTKQWLETRDSEASVGGVGWVSDRLAFDETCVENLELRSQNVDFEVFGQSVGLRPEDASERDLRQLVRKIEAPVMLTGAFQDEQTGPLFTGLTDHFDATDVLRVRMWNGRHPDGYTTMNIEAVFEFLELFVHQQVPEMNELMRIGLPIELASNFNSETYEDFPPSRLAAEFGDDYDAALAAFLAEPPITVIFENGAGSGEPGRPGGTFERTFEVWPTPQASPRTWYLGADGALTDAAPEGDGGADAFAHDPEAGAEDFFDDEGYKQFDPVWSTEWTQYPDGSSLSYVTEPFTDDVLLGGPGEVTLWVGSEADDADIQVTLTEIRPDGNESLLQSAYLRSSHRAVDEATSVPLRVEHPFTEAAQEPIPEGERVEVRIAVPSVAAPIRAGSALRLQIGSPGRNHGTWLFDGPYDDPDAAPVHTIGRSEVEPSSLVLSLLPPDDIPPEAPDCTWLRGQPCRPYEPSTNRSAEG